MVSHFLEMDNKENEIVCYLLDITERVYGYVRNLHRKKLFGFSN